MFGSHIHTISHYRKLLENLYTYVPHTSGPGLNSLQNSLSILGSLQMTVACRQLPPMLPGRDTD